MYGSQRSTCATCKGFIRRIAAVHVWDQFEAPSYSVIEINSKQQVPVCRLHTEVNDISMRHQRLLPQPVTCNEEMMWRWKLTSVMEWIIRGILQMTGSIIALNDMISIEVCYLNLFNNIGLKTLICHPQYFGSNRSTKSCIPRLISVKLMLYVMTNEWQALDCMVLLAACYLVPAIGK